MLIKSKPSFSLPLDGVLSLCATVLDDTNVVRFQPKVIFSIDALHILQLRMKEHRLHKVSAYLISRIVYQATYPALKSMVTLLCFSLLR